MGLKSRYAVLLQPVWPGLAVGQRLAMTCPKLGLR